MSLAESFCSRCLCNERRGMGFAHSGNGSSDLLDWLFVGVTNGI
jgi:hypothetical protein